MVQDYVQKQHKFWTFAKAAYKGQKGIFHLNLPKKVMNPPVFLDDILIPFVPMHSEAAVPSYMLEDEPALDSETETTPSPPPL